MPGRPLVFATATEMVRIAPEALVCIVADGNYSVVRAADGGEHVLTLQLGQVEKRLAEMPGAGAGRFIRIGKSLIVNRGYIAYIHVPRQRLVLSDGLTFRHELSASRDALRQLRNFIETEEIP